MAKKQPPVTPSPKRPSGGAYLKSKDLKPVLLGLKAEEHEIIRQAAEYDRRSMRQFIALHALAAAKKLLASRENGAGK